MGRSEAIGLLASFAALDISLEVAVDTPQYSAAPSPATLSKAD